MQLNTLGDRVQYKRQTLGLNISQLAQKCETTPVTISAIEKGNNNNPTLKLLKNIADFFDVSLDWLVYGREEIITREQYDQLTEFERKFIKEYIEFCIDRKHQK